MTATLKKLAPLLVLVVLIGGATVFYGFGRGTSATPEVAGPRRPVLVELFTSEGCSSCPPADALLARLDATQFVPGAQAIVLSEHVTYWDRLGWRDPFSLDLATQRQQSYGQRFNLDDVYTPQAVVDGAAQIVGSDEQGLRREVAKAAQREKTDLSITQTGPVPDGIRFTVHLSPSAPAANAILVAALADESVQSSVARGENAGHTLRHVAVVRELQQFRSGFADGQPLQLKLPPRAANSLPASKSRLRLVVFLVQAKTGQVIGADERAVP